MPKRDLFAKVEGEAGEGLEGEPLEAPAPLTTPEPDDHQYELDDLLRNSEAIFGYKAHAVVGAISFAKLSGDRFSKNQIREALQSYMNQAESR
jgi:hypothetical protein